MIKKYPITLEGKKKLEKELKYLKEDKQIQLNNEIKRLRGFCDFSEDVSFKDMINKQILVQDRIDQIEEILLNTEVIKSKNRDNSKVMLGSKVKFRELPDGEDEVYKIVGSEEANPAEGMISIDSPIGKSILNSSLGEKIYIEVPSGKIKIQILEIL